MSENVNLPPTLASISTLLTSKARIPGTGLPIQDRALTGSSQASKTRSAEALNRWLVLASTFPDTLPLLASGCFGGGVLGCQQIIDGLKPARPKGLLGCNPLLSLR